MIDALALFDAEVCRATVRSLDSISDHWSDRNQKSERTFFTVGRASYLDVCAPGVNEELAYYGQLALSNALLLHHFGTVYDQLRAALRGVLDAPVVLATTLAFPGFHIFCGSGIRGAGNSGQHFDVQYLRLKCPLDRIQGDPLSFTVALELPANGSGLEVWDITADDYNRSFQSGRVSSLDDMVQRRVCSYHGYALGTLFLHRGLWLHRIRSPGPVHPDDRRITLQGHGLFIDGQWHLYW